MLERLKFIARDPRHFQIAALSTLVALQMFWADFGPAPYVVALTICTALIVQAMFSFFMKIKFDFRSPFISGLSLSILLKAGAVWVIPFAAVIAISSKFLFRANNKHIFNPANIAIVVMILAFPQLSWVSPGQWGSEVLLVFLLASLAFFVLYKIPSRDMAFLFLGTWVAMIFGRALYLGDPLSIPMHQLQNGALLIFAFFMISDPKTIPDHFIGRGVFAFVVCALAYILQFQFQVREALFFALAFACLVRPGIEHFWRGQAYVWATQLTKEEEKIHV